MQLAAAKRVSALLFGIAAIARGGRRRGGIPAPSGQRRAGVPSGAPGAAHADGARVARVGDPDERQVVGHDVGQGPRWDFEENNGCRPRDIKEGKLVEGDPEIKEQHGKDRVVKTRAKKNPEPNRPVSCWYW